ncbi:MAG: DNA alkylation repair protein [Synergistaceae bacterium]|jgi:3-methyladenine DNA glycosylase AlkD|nr:DNA alkylation repair protein [Synergistaceae bacterium]
MYAKIIQAYKDSSDAAQAAAMSAYMRGQFPFLGIPRPKRKEISKAFFNAVQGETEINRAFVDDCWEREREFQYLAVEYLAKLERLLTPGDISLLRRMAVTKSWWDTIDGLDRIAGGIALRFPEVNQTLLVWSVDENIWLRRIAIDHQLTRKDRTDVVLLEQIIANNFGQKEFFINKAIGWSLREYSKTNPGWVRGFLAKYKDKLAPLSLREASKYV